MPFWKATAFQKGKEEKVRELASFYFPDSDIGVFVGEYPFSVKTPYGDFEGSLFLFVSAKGCVVSDLKECYGSVFLLQVDLSHDPPSYEVSGYWTISMNESVFAMPSEESDLFPFVSVLKEQIEGRDLHASPRLRGPVRDVKNCLAILFQWKRKGQKRGLLVGRGDFPAGFDLETQLQDKQ